MLISYALAHGGSDTGSSGAGNAVLIMVGAGILVGLIYVGRKRCKSERRGSTAPMKSVMPEILEAGLPRNELFAIFS